MSPTGYPSRGGGAVSTPASDQLRLLFQVELSTLLVPCACRVCIYSLEQTRACQHHPHHPSHLLDRQAPHRSSWGADGQLGAQWPRALIANMAVSRSSALPKTTLCPRIKQVSVVLHDWWAPMDPVGSWTTAQPQEAAHKAFPCSHSFRTGILPQGAEKLLSTSDCHPPSCLPQGAIPQLRLPGHHLLWSSTTRSS